MSKLSEYNEAKKRAGEDAGDSLVQELLNPTVFRPSVAKPAESKRILTIAEQWSLDEN